MARFVVGIHTQDTLTQEIKEMIAAALKDGVTSGAVKIFTAHAEAEAKTRGKPAEHIRFHEIEAADTTADIVGAVVIFCVSIHAHITGWTRACDRSCEGKRKPMPTE
ncbi:MAG: LarC family nickel insertion protein [Helicobacteraceae bacterium]|jgi:uncharacterized protein (DUF111 family)|nr:LarC family nickel insertion protein [Helicobacteraceae bacterium]